MQRGTMFWLFYRYTRRTIYALTEGNRNLNFLADVSKVVVR